MKCTNSLFLLFFINIITSIIVIRMLGDNYILLSIFIQSFISSFFYFKDDHRYISLILFSMVISFFVMYYYINNFNVIIGLDAERYAAFVDSYTNLNDLIEDGIEQTLYYASIGEFRGPGSYFMFGLPLSLYFDLIGSDNINATIVFDLTFKFVIIKIIQEIISPNSTVNKLLVVSLLISPTICFFVFTLGKDIFSFFLTLWPIYLFLKCKRNTFIFTFIFVVLLYSFSLRPYSPIVTVLYFYYVESSFSQLLRIFSGSYIILFLVAIIKQKYVLINCLFVIGFLFLTPNPISLSNYSSAALLPVLAQLSIFIFAMSSIIYKRKLRFDFIKLELMPIMIYGLIMTLVGLYAFSGTGGSYSIGTIGDDIFRKHLLILPIILVFYIKIILINDTEVEYA